MKDRAEEIGWAYTMDGLECKIGVPAELNDIGNHQG